MKPRLNTQIQVLLGHNIERPNQLRRHRQEPVLRKRVPRTLAATATKGIGDLAAFGLASFDGERGAVRIGQIAIGIEGIGRRKERGIVRVDPDVLQDYGAGGDVVAAEVIGGVEGVGEVYGGYGTPAQDL